MSWTIEESHKATVSYLNEQIAHKDKRIADLEAQIKEQEELIGAWLNAHNAATKLIIELMDKRRNAND